MCQIRGPLYGESATTSHALPTGKPRTGRPPQRTRSFQRPGGCCKNIIRTRQVCEAGSQPGLSKLLTEVPFEAQRRAVAAISFCQEWFRLMDNNHSGEITVRKLIIGMMKYQDVAKGRPKGRSWHSCRCCFACCRLPSSPDLCRILRLSPSAGMGVWDHAINDFTGLSRAMGQGKTRFEHVDSFGFWVKINPSWPRC